MSLDLKKEGVVGIAKHVNQGDVSAIDVVKYYIDCIEKNNDELNIYLEVFENCLSEAKIVDEKVKAGEKFVLAGVPMAIKDNILIKGQIASAGSKILENYCSPYSATVIEKLRKEGVIFLGRTNMDEFAMGSSTENSGYGVTKNPLDTTRVPGGSSGGSAAAVSAGLAPGALGSETGGSIRQPASFCGVVGLKPTYGSVSRYGLVAMASSLDQIGPIANNVEDVEVLYKIIEGCDEKDSTSGRVKADNYKKTKKIAYPEEFLRSGVDEDVLSNFYSDLDQLKGEGYTLEPVDAKSLEYALAVYYIIMPAEASSNLARFDGIKYGLSVEGHDAIDRYHKTRGLGFGSEVRRRVMLGTYVLSSGYYDAYYKQATDVRNMMKNEFEKIFSNYDAFVTPTSPTPAFKIGERTQDPLKMYKADLLTVSANLTGMPAISIPSGEVKRDDVTIPTGFQIMSSYNCEDTIFKIGKKIENGR